MGDEGAGQPRSSRRRSPPTCLDWQSGSPRCSSTGSSAGKEKDASSLPLRAAGVSGQGARGSSDEAARRLEPRSLEEPEQRPIFARLPCDLTSAGAARRLVREALAGALSQETIQVAVLLTSELVANAVTHARSVVEVLVVPRRDGTLRVGVSDGSRALPTVGQLGGSAKGGRGLALVRELTHDWGVTATPTGKTVWFVLASNVGHPVEQQA